MLELPGSGTDQSLGPPRSGPSLPDRVVECALGDLMAAHHWSLSEVAHRCGLPRLTIRRWRDNRVTAYSRRVLARLCTGLGVEVGSLIILKDGSRKARTTKPTRRTLLPSGGRRVKPPQAVVRR